MPRKERMWAHVIDTATTVAGGGDNLQNLLGAYVTEIGINEIRGKTIGTIIGDLVFIDSVAVGNASNTISRVAFGIFVGQTGLQAANAPVPGTDSYPWMWFKDYHYVQSARRVAGLSGSEVFRNIEHRVPIHIKAMRKLTMNQALFLKVHVFSGADVNVAFAGNCLLLG